MWSLALGVFMVFIFISGCMTITRFISLLLLNDGYTTDEIAGVLASRVVGNLLGMIVFTKLLVRLGNLKLLVIGII